MLKHASDMPVEQRLHMRAVSYTHLQQEALFRLMGDVAGTVGVTLTTSSLMLPSKSISGFYFSAEEHFETCRYCPLLHCPSRQEAYRGPAD